MTEKFTQALNDSHSINNTEDLLVGTLNQPKAYTQNNAISNPSPDASGETAGRMALFFKSVRGLTDNQLEEYLIKASSESILDTFLIAFYIRDCRGGKGERELGRKCLRWLSRYPEQFNSIIKYISEYGRWDDYLVLLEALEKPKPSRRVKKVSSDSDDDSEKNNSCFIGIIDSSNSNNSCFTGITDSNIITALISSFSLQLKNDLQTMNEGKPCTLVAKWAPTENCSLDRKYDLVNKICKNLSISKRNYRKTYLAPLRAYIKIVERYMCHKNWEAIDYSSVPSCAMKRLKKAFSKNDPIRFEEWKAKLQKGEVKVNAKQLYPHELVRDVYASDDNIISDAQWNVLVEKTKKMGVFSNSLVVVDVSGSMGSMGQKKFCPIHASVALGLIISECIQGPLQNQIITFHATPTFFNVQGSTLKERINSISQAPWGGNTNFQKIFDLILSKAKEYKLKQEDMPKTLYILSDMQFDQAVSLDGKEEKTNYQMVLDKFNMAGYTPPNIIFWNLNGNSVDFPCTTNDFGTAMISGFSTDILKSILTLGRIDPYNVMRVTIDSERYHPVADAIKNTLSIPEIESHTSSSGWLSGWFSKA